MRTHAAMPLAAGIARLGVLQIVINMAIVVSQKFAQERRHGGMIEKACEAWIGIEESGDGTVQVMPYSIRVISIECLDVNAFDLIHPARVLGDFITTQRLAQVQITLHIEGEACIVAERSRGYGHQ